MHHFRPYSIREEWVRKRNLWGKFNSSKDLLPAKKMKYFDENGTTVIVKLTSLNHFQVSQKDSSNNLLNPNPETDLITTNSCISLSEYNNHQQSIYPTLLLQYLHYTRNIDQN